MEISTQISIVSVFTVITMLGCLGVLARSLWVDFMTINPMQERIAELYRQKEIDHREIESLKQLRNNDLLKIAKLEIKIALMQNEVGRRDTKILELQGQVVALEESVALKECRIQELENERATRTPGTNPLKPL